MNMTEINKLDSKELVIKVAELKKELFDLRFQAAAGQLENPAKVTENKKTIARIKTVLNQRAKEVK